MTEEMSRAKARVEAIYTHVQVWPPARNGINTPWRIAAQIDGEAGWTVIGYGSDVGPAWLDAASRLPAEPKDEPVGDEMCPDCMSDVKAAQLNVGNYRCDNDWHKPVELKAEGAEKPHSIQVTYENKSAIAVCECGWKSVSGGPVTAGGFVHAMAAEHLGTQELESRNAELQRKGEELCHVLGGLGIHIHELGLRSVGEMGQWKFRNERAEKTEREVQRLKELVEAIDATLCPCSHSSAQSAVGCNCDIHAVHRLIAESRKAESSRAAQKEGK